MKDADHTEYNPNASTPLLVLISYAVGMTKADPRIFQMAIERLNVKPEHCMYIADDMRQELANAANRV